MQMKSIVAGAAIALAFTVGSAHAAEQFATLTGVPAEPLTEAIMASTLGSDIVFIMDADTVPGGTIVLLPTGNVHGVLIRLTNGPVAFRNVPCDSSFCFAVHDQF